MRKGDLESYRLRPDAAKKVRAAFHVVLEARAVELIATGIAPDEARKQAAREKPREREHVKNMTARMVDRDRKIAVVMRRTGCDEATAAVEVDTADHDRDSAATLKRFKVMGRYMTKGNP